jgi:hypothetical protein
MSSENEQDASPETDEASSALIGRAKQAIGEADRLLSTVAW